MADDKDSGSTSFDPSKVGSFFELSAKTAKHEAYPFKQYEGKVVLVVNVASQCGFTPQYDGLEALYQKYKEQGLVIIGFPCNQFGGQEPGTEEEIVEFCRKNHGVTFPLTEKIEVNGDNTNDVYRYLKSKKSQLGLSRIKWNFEKFLISKKGQVVDRYSSLAKPHDMEKDIQKELAK